MIWFVFGSLLLLILIYILPPILAGTPPQADDGQETLAELKQQLVKLQADVDQGIIDTDTASESRQALERFEIEFYEWSALVLPGSQHLHGNDVLWDWQDSYATAV